MEEKKKSNVGLIVFIVILLIACAGMGTFIFINKDKLTAKEDVTTTEESNKQDTNEKANTIETRKCTGLYSGTAAISKNVVTGEYGKGELSIELKSDGTYELKKENIDGGTGSYTIIEDALLLKTSPHTCGPGADCSAKYSNFLEISSDCSTISWGYGSYFFDPNFTLTKKN